jgi:tetratricopeptide (TPR) repeat protein
MQPSVNQLLQEGVGHHQAGRLSEAEQCYQQILVRQPGHVDAVQLLGVIAHQAGRHDLAIDWIGRAITLNPNVPAFHNNLGEAHRAAGNLDQAATCYRRAIALERTSPDARANLIRALMQQQNQAEALAEIWSAFDLGQDVVQILIDIIVGLTGEFKFDQAMALARAAMAKRPQDARLLVVLGNTLHAAGQLDESLTAYHQALEILPESGEAHWNKALVLLTRGDYLSGWKEYEWRWRCANFPYKRQDFGKPFWDGSDLRDKTVLLDSEGGFGDIIQFVRYARLLAERGGRVVLGCPPELKELLKSVAGVDQIVTRGETLPPLDFQLPLLTCPLRFGTTLETIPSPGSYIAASPQRVALFTERFSGQGSGLQVGLVWCGRNMPYPNRSCPLSQCAPLFEIPGIQFHSLQRDDGRAELASALANWRIVDHGDALKDFSDTAAVIAHLDLVITIDSAVAHLAGAMGKPVWVMVPHSPDWRWMMERDDCAWYPTMKLYRQAGPNQWSAVTTRVAAALRAL